MPQVDLETLVSACAGGPTDHKITCETLAAHSNTPESELDPPDSFRLSKGEEVEWFDRNAFYERKDSTKSTNLNHNQHQSNSQRFTNLKSKPSIIGLPKSQKAYFNESKNRRICNKSTRLFQKRGKQESSVKEPTSPKVSCMGRVKSRRDRSRRLRNRQRSTSRRSDGLNDFVSKEKRERKQKSGLFSKFKSMFKHHPKEDVKESESETASSYKRAARVSDIRERLPPEDRDAIPRRSGGVDGGEPAGLGGLKRFASGRRSESILGN